MKPSWRYPWGFYDLTESEAKKRIRARESKRHRFVKNAYGKDIENPVHYDIVLNAKRWVLRLWPIPLLVLRRLAEQVCEICNLVLGVRFRMITILGIFIVYVDANFLYFLDHVCRVLHGRIKWFFPIIFTSRPARLVLRHPCTGPGKPDRRCSPVCAQKPPYYLCLPPRLLGGKLQHSIGIPRSGPRSR
jgi:hypothetical protein